MRCPALPKPKNGRKSENRYWPGTIVRFSCDDGFRLVGYEVRRCREDGLWSWGVDPHCIKDSKYKLTIGGIFVGLIVPVLVVIAISLVCWRRQRKSVFYTPPKNYVKNDNKSEQTIKENTSFVDTEPESHPNGSSGHLDDKTPPKSAFV